MALAFVIISTPFFIACLATTSLLNPGANAPTIFTQFISGAIGIMSIIAGIWFLFKIITGGLAIIGSDGDAQKVADAKGQITNGLIGLIVVIAATFLVSLLGTLLGFPSILDPASLIDTVRVGGP